jgi:hypothetical protein
MPADEYFIQRVGHGIGRTTHEPPFMIEGRDPADRPGSASRSSHEMRIVA